MTSHTESHTTIKTTETSALTAGTVVLGIGAAAAAGCIFIPKVKRAGKVALAGLSMVLLGAALAMGTGVKGVKIVDTAETTTTSSSSSNTTNATMLLAQKKNEVTAVPPAPPAGDTARYAAPASNPRVLGVNANAAIPLGAPGGRQEVREGPMEPSLQFFADAPAPPAAPPADMAHNHPHVIRADPRIAKYVREQDDRRISRAALEFDTPADRIQRRMALQREANTGIRPRNSNTRLVGYLPVDTPY